MKLATKKNRVLQYLFLFALVGLMGACASSKVDAPSTQKAATTIEKAEQAGAEQYAPDHLNKATQELQKAQKLIDEEEYEKAAKVIRQANVDAKLALLTTRSKKNETAIGELREPVQQLREKIEETNAKIEMSDRGAVLTFADILFEIDKANLKPGALKTMGKLAQFLKKHSNYNILIEGYTDSAGPSQYNLELSKQRANSAKQALVDSGIASSRIKTVGYGEKYPVASNNTAVGRQLNRRVDVVISPNNEPIEPRTDENNSTEQPTQDKIKLDQSNENNVEYN